MEMQIELMSPEDLTPYENNAKIHSQESVDKLANAIKTQGWQGNPIIVDEENVIVAGHGRRLAALQIGLEKVPVYVTRGKTPEQLKAMRLSDNRVAIGEYDTDMIRNELLELAEFDIDMTDLGFDEGEIDFGLTEDDDDEINAMLEGIDDESNDDSEIDVKVERPKPEGEDYVPGYSVVVELDSEDAQEKLYMEMKSRGHTCRILSA
jgi:ParB-like chromosome segregation protein Spo0J